MRRDKVGKGKRARRGPLWRCDEPSHRVLLALALDEGRVAAVEVELVHLLLVEADDRVVVVGGVLDNEAVGLGLGAQDGRRRVVLAAGGTGGLGVGADTALSCRNKAGGRKVEETHSRETRVEGGGEVETSEAAAEGERGGGRRAERKKKKSRERGREGEKGDERDTSATHQTTTENIASSFSPLSLSLAVPTRAVSVCKPQRTWCGYSARERERGERRGETREKGESFIRFFRCPSVCFSVHTDTHTHSLSPQQNTIFQYQRSPERSSSLKKEKRRTARKRGRKRKTVTVDSSLRVGLLCALLFLSGPRALGKHSASALRRCVEAARVCARACVCVKTERRRKGKKETSGKPRFTNERMCVCVCALYTHTHTHTHTQRRAHTHTHTSVSTQYRAKRERKGERKTVFDEETAQQ